MDKARRRSTGPTSGQGRGKDKRNHPRSQAKEKNDEDHRAPQRNVGPEEVASRASICADAKERPTSSNGTSPIASRRGHYAGRGGREEHGANRGRLRINDQGINRNTHVRCAQIKYRASSTIRKGTHIQVPSSGRSC
jgi:hypothetical protein